MSDFDEIVAMLIRCGGSDALPALRRTEARLKRAIALLAELRAAEREPDENEDDFSVDDSRWDAWQTRMATAERAADAFLRSVERDACPTCGSTDPRKVLGDIFKGCIGQDHDPWHDMRLKSESET